MENHFNLSLIGAKTLGEYKAYGVVGAILIAIVLPLFATIFMRIKKPKQRGVVVEVGGEPGYAMRNARTPDLLEVPWEGATTMAALFEQSCEKHSQSRFLGKRKVISREFITDNSSGRKFEKYHLGEYRWETYGEIFARACDFASGLVTLGHDVDTRVAIFAESRPEWLISFQVTFVSIFRSCICFMLLECR